MTSGALIRALLKAEIDLLWFGTIGTSLKSETETVLEVGDRAERCTPRQRQGFSRVRRR